MSCKDSYVALAVANLECKHFTWFKDRALVQACNDLYDQLLSARQECGRDFILALHKGDQPEKTKQE